MRTGLGSASNTFFATRGVFRARPELAARTVDWLRHGHTLWVLVFGSSPVVEARTLGLGCK